MRFFCVNASVRLNIYFNYIFALKFIIDTFLINFSTFLFLFFEWRGGGQIKSPNLLIRAFRTHLKLGFLCCQLGSVTAYKSFPVRRRWPAET